MATRHVVIAAVLGSMLTAACSSGGHSSAQSSPTTTAAGAEATTVAPTGSSATAAGCPGGTTVTGSAGGADTAPPGDIPDNQAFVTFSPAAGGYEIKVPEGWSRTEDAKSVTFTDKYNSIHVEVMPSASAPTAASARAELPSLAASVPCFSGAAVTSITRKAGPAILIKYTARSAPNGVTGKVVNEDVERYEFWRNGNEAVITLSASAGSDNVDPWKIVTDSFAWR
jgi:hypothetical protein